MLRDQTEETYDMTVLDKVSIMKMFNMINIGERAGSGVTNIFQTWDAAEWISPVVEEQFNSDRTILRLAFINVNDDMTTQATQGKIKTNPNVVAQVYNLLDMELKILNVLKKEPTMSQSKLAEELGTNTNIIKYYISKMKKLGIISREGSSQKGRWIVKI